MSFWKKLFGGRDATAEADEGAPLAEQDYKGYQIRATLMRAGGEFQLAGEIEKTIEGEVKVHHFVRADRFPTREDAASRALTKGQQLVDEQGDRLFA